FTLLLEKKEDAPPRGKAMEEPALRTTRRPRGTIAVTLLRRGLAVMAAPLPWQTMPLDSCTGADWGGKAIGETNEGWYVWDGAREYDHNPRGHVVLKVDKRAVCRHTTTTFTCLASRSTLRARRAKPLSGPSQPMWIAGCRSGPKRA